MTAQQMTGINIFAFLAATLFESGKPNPDKSTENPGNLNEDPDRASLWLYFGFGIANFLSSMIAYRYIDRKGRRWLLMSSLVAIFPFLLATALSFLATGKQKSSLVAIFLVLYTIAYSPEVGMAWASAVSWMGAGIVALCVPFLIKSRLQPTGVLCLFAGLDAIALLLVWLFVPGMERQTPTMEEMNYIFGVALRRHVSYQIKEVAPWSVKHYILRRNVAYPDPLYRYVHNTQDTNDTAGLELHAL
ncbi:MAG: hypothetical protein Q9200_002825 [Gallowayella weberi]